jgi:hypothetical protein
MVTDIHITYRYGWALIEDTVSGRTALTIPSVDEGPPQAMRFEVVGWHENYEDASYVVSMMEASDVTVADYLAQHQPEPEPEPEPELIEGVIEPEPEPQPKRKRRSPTTLLTLW